jgi:hypothetical protein
MPNKSQARLQNTPEYLHIVYLVQVGHKMAERDLHSAGRDPRSKFDDAPPVGNALGGRTARPSQTQMRITLEYMYIVEFKRIGQGMGKRDLPFAVRDSVWCAYRR